jgi:cyclophilin family peptidyl-prolyl cis-trans isomerase
MREMAMTQLKTISHPYSRTSLGRTAAGTALALVLGLPPAVDAATVKTIVRMETSLGAIHVGLYDDDAPVTVANFLGYVNSGDYDSTLIHRSEPNFVIQGGGYFSLVPPGPFHVIEAAPIANEFDPSRLNKRGTIAMARSSALDSATSEWFFNLQDNPGLDDVANNNQFAVFGEVLESGMTVVDQIAALPTQPLAPPVLIPPLVNGFFFPGFGDDNFVSVFRVCFNMDRDGVCQQFENFAPNNGDGNNDGTPDRDQPNVASTRLSVDGRSITFATAKPTLRFDSAGSFNAETTAAGLATFVPPPQTIVQFNDGAYTFAMAATSGAMDPNGETVTLFDRAATRPTRYYAFADGNPTRWFDFTFDGRTGAEILPDRIVLHFVDGERGDDDAVIGTITHTGAPAIESPVPAVSSNNAGCAITKNTRRTSPGAEWGVILAFLGFAYHRVRARKSAR